MLQQAELTTSSPQHEDHELKHANVSLIEDEISWTQEEETRLVRKVDVVVMPLLMIAFMALQLDRGNIGNALTDKFLEDVGITQNEFNIGKQLLSTGIIITEIPSNILLYRFGARIWITFQIMAWGLVATFQAFQKGRGAHFFTRLLLGICESGFIPAGLYCITTWYKRTESSKRISFYFVGNMFAQATGGLIAYGLLKMRGVAGLSGWQWLFIIEGVFTIVIGALFVILFPHGPENPVTLFGLRYFNERESYILVQRVVKDDPSKRKTNKSISIKQLGSALSSWRVYIHAAVCTLALAPVSALGSYAPSLVSGFGDRTRNRSSWVIGGLALWFIFTLCCRLLIYSHSKEKRYAVLALALSVSSIWHPVNSSWVALNSRNPGERSILMAVYIMSANLAGVAGAQIFRSEDKPIYLRAWSTVTGMTAAALILSVLLLVQYWASNKIAQKRNKSTEQTRRLYQY